VGAAHDLAILQGRIFLLVHAADGMRPPDGVQPRSFSASFELAGDAGQGELRLFSPLGTQLVRMEWSPGRAMLTIHGETRRYFSQDEMLRQVTGEDIPVSALLAWLNGRDIDQPGWQVNLAHFVDGKIVAERLSPLPRLELRIALER
jgi:outer membrane lipoprotein LolB